MRSRRRSSSFQERDWPWRGTWGKAEGQSEDPRARACGPAAPSAPPGEQHPPGLASPHIPEWAGVSKRCGLRLSYAATLAALGKASSCRGCGAQSLGLEIQLELWVRGKPAAPRGASGLILDLAASHFVTQRSPQTDSSQLPPSQGRVGCTTTKTTAMIIMTASIYYMFSVFQMMYHSATLLCITSSNHLPALCDRIWMIFAFYC